MPGLYTTPQTGFTLFQSGLLQKNGNVWALYSCVASIVWYCCHNVATGICHKNLQDTPYILYNASCGKYLDINKALISVY